MINVTLANQILSYVTSKISGTQLTSSGQCYLGFSTTTPNSTGGNFTEPSPSRYPSYKRIQLNIYEASEYTDLWGTVSNGRVSNAVEVTSAECLEEGGWPEFTHFGIFPQKTGGQFLMADELTDPDGEPDEDGRYPAKPLKVEKNHVAIFSIGKLQLRLS